ncbi:hypothetical protein FQN60_000457 [Etheostoma spectabile]|uniref:RFX1 transcription activation region domain-containing protein n=1 Tax=Etheostoma spectabile TaxID=54343 RepID=A0A5J5D538_9PERO|nr:hypothetical protein FQN60_000457 [Etheostoma spectabile]
MWEEHLEHLETPALPQSNPVGLPARCALHSPLNPRLLSSICIGLLRSRAPPSVCWVSFSWKNSSNRTFHSSFPAEKEVKLGWLNSPPLKNTHRKTTSRNQRGFCGGSIRADPLRRSIKMSVHTTQKRTTTYQTVNVASPEPVTSTVISSESVSPMPYAINGNYETMRYLVPVQQAVQQQSYIPVQQQQSYIPVQQQQSYYVIQQPNVMMQQQPIMQQVVSPVYLQRMSHLSVSSQDSADLMYQQQSTTESRSVARAGKRSTVGNDRHVAIAATALQR